MIDRRHPEPIITEATRLLLENGVRVFQGALMGATEDSHCQKLLRLMRPEDGSLILDMGCGIGEVARLMRRARGDLRFWLVNDNAFQLSEAPVSMPRSLTDFHHVPLPSAVADGAMYLYSLCHADLWVALKEAARLVRRDGFLFVYDYERIKGDNALFFDRLGATAFSREEYEIALLRTGWQLDFWSYPTVNDTRFRVLYGNEKEYDRVFSELRVVCWRAWRL